LSRHTSSVLSCAASTDALHDVSLKIIKNDPQSGTAIVILDETVQVPNECRFSVEFPTITLEENVGYAWRVGDPGDIEDANTVWNSFMYAPLSMGEESPDDSYCSNNMVADGSFSQRNGRWQTSAMLQTPYTVIFQQLDQPFEAGKYYRLKFSVKHGDNLQSMPLSTMSVYLRLTAATVVRQ